jgi:hypothetical protein
VITTGAATVCEAFQAATAAFPARVAWRTTGDAVFYTWGEAAERKAVNAIVCSTPRSLDEWKVGVPIATPTFHPFGAGLPPPVSPSLRRRRSSAVLRPVAADGRAPA